MTLKEFAKKLGISRCTVSRAINGSPLVSEKTRRHVLQSMREIGFAPNAAARTLVKRKSNVVGFFIVENRQFTDMSVEAVLNDAFVRGLFGGIYSEAFKNGFSVMFKLVWDDLSEISSAISSGSLDGAVVAFGAVTKDFSNELKQVFNRSKLPVVYVDDIYGKPHDNGIYTDNYYGALSAVNHLLSLGHTRIAHISGKLSGRAGSLRCQAYKDAMEDAGIPIDKKLMVNGDFTESSGKLAMEEILKNGEPPSAIFAANDRMALAAMSVLNSAGLKVPKDISIVGFDDIEVASYSVPKLTTVKYPVFNAGIEGVKLLLESMENNGKKQVNLSNTELVIRDSTKAI